MCWRMWCEWSAGLVKELGLKATVNIPNHLQNHLATMSATEQGNRLYLPECHLGAGKTQNVHAAGVIQLCNLVGEHKDNTVPHTRNYRKV